MRKLVNKAKKEFTIEINTALKKAGLPVDKFTRGLTAKYMQQYFVIYEKFPKAKKVMYLVASEIEMIGQFFKKYAKNR